MKSSKEVERTSSVGQVKPEPETKPSQAQPAKPPVETRETREIEEKNEPAPQEPGAKDVRTGPAAPGAILGSDSPDPEASAQQKLEVTQIQGAVQSGGLVFQNRSGQNIRIQQERTLVGGDMSRVGLIDLRPNDQTEFMPGAGERIIIDVVE